MDLEQEIRQALEERDGDHIIASIAEFMDVHGLCADRELVTQIPSTSYAVPGQILR